MSVQWVTPVLRAELANGSVSSLVTRRGTWRVGQVLNAGGPWGAKVASMAGTTVPLTPQRIQVCVAKAPGDGEISAADRCARSARRRGAGVVPG